MVVMSACGLGGYNLKAFEALPGSTGPLSYIAAMTVTAVEMAELVAKIKQGLSM